jgi:heme oxygenase
MSSNLAEKLRCGTQQAHTAIENMGFMKCFVKGVVDRNCFAKFLGNLYYIYSELETALEHHKDLFFNQCGIFQRTQSQSSFGERLRVLLLSQLERANHTSKSHPGLRNPHP